MMLKSHEDELMRQLRVIDGLELVRQVSTALAETGGRMPINDINAAARASSTYLAKRFKAVVGVTPKRLARSCRFTSTVLAIDVDRKSTRLNSSHVSISYAVFCLKK